MSTGLANRAVAQAFVDELARCGVRHACVSPGSRSTPLALVLAEDARIRVWIHPDERSGSFFALGLAKASNIPVALLCTSGTAAANFFPAVVEAAYARVPLLVLTADRPPELRDNGAPQAIDQSRLYGVHVRWYTEMPVPASSPGIERHVRVTACRAFAAALGSPTGPVHLNFPFREPLLPDPADFSTSLPGGGRPNGEPYVRVTRGRRRLDDQHVRQLAADLDAPHRGLIVCGPQDDGRLAGPLVRLAHRLGYPVLADGLSPLRTGPHDRCLVIDTHDAFLRDPAWCDAHEPEVVVRFGAMPTSKPLVQYLGRFPQARHIVVDEGEGWRDSSLLAAEMVYADPVAFCDQLDTALGHWQDPPVTWAQEWQDAHARTQRTISDTLAGMSGMFEGKIFAELRGLLPDGATLFVGNSMPVRDLDTFLGATDTAIRTLCNRGANGIDGVISTALGASVECTGPLVLAIGDLSFYHDMNGLLAAKQYGLNATIVLINNDGGGIFSFLPQAEHREHFETLYGTPHGLDFCDAVWLYGGEYMRADTWSDFRAAVVRGIASPGLTVVEVRTDRERNVRLHRDVWAGVADALHTGVRAEATP